MDPRERLRLALRGAGCARCGQPYGVQGIHVLAQREEIAFVQLVCSACQIQTLALVTGVPPSPDGPDDEAGSPQGAVADEQPSLVAPSEDPPISIDDVDEMRSFLASYEGDLHDLLGRGRGRDRE